MLPLADRERQTVQVTLTCDLAGAPPEMTSHWGWGLCRERAGGTQSAPQDGSACSEEGATAQRGKAGPVPGRGRPPGCRSRRRCTRG